MLSGTSKSFVDDVIPEPINTECRPTSLWILFPFASTVQLNPISPNFFTSVIIWHDSIENERTKVSWLFAMDILKVKHSH